MKSTPAWLSTEGSQVPPSQTTLAQITITPKTVGAVVNFSRQLSLQANAESFVRRELLRTVATAIDLAVLNGSGAVGQPLGLLGTNRCANTKRDHAERRHLHDETEVR